MNIDRAKFKRTDFPPAILLVNEEESIAYWVSDDEIRVISIEYRPKKEDYKLVVQSHLRKVVNKYSEL